MEIENEITILNDWWKSGSISGELAKGYKRKVFVEFKRLFKSHREVLVLSGLRRVGKTTIIYQQIMDLLKEHKPRSIVYFTFDYVTINLVELLDTYSKLTGIDWKHEKIFLFLDEIQKLKEWSSQVKVLFDAFPNLKIVVSGSASLQLEKDAMDNLAGRHFMLEIKPLSLLEFYELKYGKVIDRPELYRSEFVAETGSYIKRPFPAAVKWRDGDVYAYIRESVLSKIIRGDLPDTFREVNIALLERMIDVFYSNPGMIINVDEMAKNFSISKTTFEKHMFFLKFAKLIRTCANFRGSAISMSRKNKKVYPYDISLAFPFNPNVGIGTITETKVASVINAKMYWREGKDEVDFVSNQKGKVEGIEVKAANILTKSDMTGLHKFARKFGAKKFLIYNGKKGNIDRVTLLNFTDFLIAEKV